MLDGQKKAPDDPCPKELISQVITTITFSTSFSSFFCKMPLDRGKKLYLIDLFEISYQNVSLISLTIVLTNQMRLLSYNCHLELFLLL